jgi:fumarate hydratase, class II
MTEHARSRISDDLRFAREVWDDESPAQGERHRWERSRSLTLAGGTLDGISHAMPGWRIETDSLGEIEVQSDKYWGAHTQRVIRFFAIGEPLMPSDLIHTYGTVKACCAMANADLGILPAWKSVLIARVAAEIEVGALDRHFPIRAFSANSGRHLDANINEVIANRANTLVGQPLGRKHPMHPDDDVNCSQNSDDSFITAVHLTLLHKVQNFTIAANRLLESLDAKIQTRRAALNISGNHFVADAAATVTEEWRGFHSSLERSLHRVSSAADGLCEVPLGGTRMSTSSVAAEGYREHVISALSRQSGYALIPATDRFGAQSSLDALCEMHGALQRFATILMRVAHGVHGQCGSKQSEGAIIVCMRVMGNDVIMGQALAADSGNSNTTPSLASFTTLESIGLLIDACSSVTYDARNDMRL